MNRYPTWKYLLICILILLGVIYAAPNIFGDDPAIEISAKNNAPLNIETSTQIQNALKNNQLNALSIKKHNDNLLVRFQDTDNQLRASDVIKAALGNNYVVALNLAPRTPAWLRSLGANPMKLGLDLRGGVHFLYELDTSGLVKAHLEGDQRNIMDQLREANIRYSNIDIQNNAINIEFRDTNSLNQAFNYLSNRFPDYQFTKNDLKIQASLTDAALKKTSQYAVDQNMAILNNRVNELGVSEAQVQQQGSDQISVDLPGIQDTARAKDIIGKTATLRFQLVDVTHDVQSAVAGNVPFGSKLYEYEGRPILLQDQVILRGSSITYATAAFGDDGRPSVIVKLGGGGESLFAQITGQNIKKPMAVIYVESQPQTKIINGKPVTVQQQVEKVINVAEIQSALVNSFEVRGLSSPKEAQDLALLLRSGSLAAPSNLIQERTIGPSLGKSNIEKGILSVEVGALLVILFMAFYYRVFGLVADLALILNIVFIVAILSVLGATLTLPGIAGIVLTVGMAVDANVLINERIREELRNGMSPQASIHAGYNRAFATIVDSNVTTLIVAIVLFALGSGPVKSFAITLTIGLLTSMVTAIFFTRGIVNLIYGNRQIKKISIGI